MYCYDTYVFLETSYNLIFTYIFLETTYNFIFTYAFLRQRVLISSILVAFYNFVYF